MLTVQVQNYRHTFKEEILSLKINLLVLRKLSLDIYKDYVCDTDDKKVTRMNNLLNYILQSSP